MENIDRIVIPAMHFFLKTDTRLTLEDRADIIGSAGRIYGMGEQMLDIAGENYVGLLKTKGEWAAVSGMSGQLFEAELETIYGKSNMTFVMHGDVVVLPYERDEPQEQWH